MKEQWKEGKKVQKEILRKLKKKSYQTLIDLNNDELAAYVEIELKSTVSIEKSLQGAEVVRIIVKVDGGKAMDYKSVISEIVPEDVSIESSSSTDGFDIFPSGKIVDMHPDEYDDD